MIMSRKGIQHKECTMKNYRFFPGALLAMAMLAGCATAPENSLLNEARNDYRAAQNDPQVANLAASELKQAEDALNRANAAANEKEAATEVTHLAYLAKQKVAIAQETAKQKQAEASVASAAAERSKIRLEARTAEVTRAEKEAEASQRQSEASQREAATSQRQSEASQREATTSQQQSEASQREAEASQRQSEVSQREAAESQQQAREAEMQTSALQAELKELNAKQTERGLVITLGDVLFDTNKAQLKARGDSLQKLADFLKQHPERKVRVEGYTDSTGGADYNVDLSNRRANAVRVALVDMGVSSDRITTRGFGMESPVANNNTPAGRQMNRRVEIVLSE
jgi:outer membrane protein OmpA-like peptidoglycan-associated protein